MFIVYLVSHKYYDLIPFGIMRKTQVKDLNIKTLILTLNIRIISRRFEYLSRSST